MCTDPIYILVCRTSVSGEGRDAQAETARTSARKQGHVEVGERGVAAHGRRHGVHPQRRGARSAEEFLHEGKLGAGVQEPRVQRELPTGTSSESVVVVI